MSTVPQKRYASPLVQSVIEAGEKLHGRPVITFEGQFEPRRGLTDAGGSCSCCGAEARIDGEDDWWLIFRAGLYDSDRVFYSKLCGGPDGSGCLPDILAQQSRRKPTLRDEVAGMMADLLGDDTDGLQAMMEDMEYTGALSQFDDEGDEVEPCLECGEPVRVGGPYCPDCGTGPDA